ncbi:MAG TPA: DUF3107 domain-containing protein [Arthrobacter sp.]|nr:DUF3107 domain-containing protein [Arthrobacter sp.]
MEIKIGIQNVGREIIIESSGTADEVADTVAKAMKDGGQLRLTDNKGRTVLVPSSVLGYVEVGAEEPRKIGFGAV